MSCRCDESIKPLIAISVYFVGSRLSQLLISSQEPLTLSNQNFDSKIFENYLPKNTRSSTFRNANRFNHRHTFLLLWCQSKTLFISDQWSVFKWGDHHEIQQPRTWESLPKLCAHIAHIILLYGLCHIIHMIWYKDQTIDALTKFSQFDAPAWLVFRSAIMTQLECLIEYFRICIFVCWLILYIWNA